MAEDNLKVTKKKSLDLLTEENIKAALRNDKGESAELVAWEAKDFTKPGDNYAGVVTSAIVKYRQNGEETQVTYIVKLNPMRGVEMFECFTHNQFIREGHYFTVFLPEMNELLIRFNEPPLRLAKGFFANMKSTQECLIMEDLRARGFKMFDRKKGVDRAHGMLVLNELGRVHAASLLKEKYIGSDSFEKYGVLEDEWDLMKSDPKMSEMAQQMYAGSLNGSIKLLEKISGYENTVEWLKEIQPKILDLVLDLFKPSEKFGVMIHGDCWNNNILFRYDSSNNPVEVMLVDFQQIKKASPAIDLNYFLYSSFMGPERTSNLDDFLKKYYTSFSTTLRAGQMDVPFTHDELCQEVKDKLLFGLVMAMFLIPVVLAESDDILDVDSLTPEKMEEFMKEREETMLKM
ncbi:unnamed protein product, partial [Meganyctiphanes norvegica]